ncbi:MAG: lipopolysaccharide biosynthesis protein [Paraprevotella sp.]|nr:lipopolysaccharide biosynthesis protein [Paraprevotella sp.]
MTDTSENNKRIAKNTLLLYFRMLLLMAVSLYTSRVVLNALGVEDFGIYNVVGGMVAMFSVLSGSLSSAISRFLTFELGRGRTDRLDRIFSTSVTIQLGLGGVVALLAETLGVWFLNVKMNIPAERFGAANWVFQYSILTFVINLISVPYNAAIIAHERMLAFAYISIFEAVAKLAVAFLIMWSPRDRLIGYAVLMCVAALSVRFAYGYYCKRHFSECVYRFLWDKGLLKQMFGFASWNFIGASSTVLRDHGGNLMINFFYGPSVNAARGIAFQVNYAVNVFILNFMTVLNPQITKSYASGNRDYMMRLIFQGARLSFYMLLILSLPILVNTQYILSLWLKNVPEHTSLFVQLCLVLAMSESLSQPLITASLATGRIRNYQIIVGGLQSMNFPVSYVLLRWGCVPETVVMVAVAISQACLAARLLLLRKMIGLSIRRYLKNVYLNIIPVTAVAAVLPGLASGCAEHDDFFKVLWLSLMAVTCTALSIYGIGCNGKEREFVHTKIRKIRHRLLHDDRNNR